MKEFSVKTLADTIRPQSATNTEGVFTGVSIDSRTTKPGDCFFAVAGENFDGHDFVADAFAKGAACAVIRDDKDKPFADKTILKVNDTVKALGDFAAQYRQKNNFKVVAITGSVGKTTARQIISHALSRHYRLFQAPKNYNNKIGLPLTLLGADPADQIIIAELGSNCPGEIAYLTAIAKPDIALVTNAHPSHLAGFGNLQTIIEEKLSISRGLRPNGTFIINGDCEQLVSACRAKNIQFITFGKSETCDIQTQNITCGDFGSTFTVNGSKITLPLLGPGNVENATAAWSVCSQLGMSIDDFTQAAKTLAPVSMRTELLQIGTLTVLNDCYNANPTSMKNALDILATLTAAPAHNRRLAFICGDMDELGPQSQALHAQLGASIAQAKVQLLLTIGRFAKITAEAAKKSANYDLQTKSFKDASLACNNLKESIKDSDIILVKGSRVNKLEMVVEKLKQLFV
jgi:UDP-N-acetylmuramoyl-tripeptide--D-alanyl-D-alanine ligase